MGPACFCCSFWRSLSDNRSPWRRAPGTLGLLLVLQRALLCRDLSHKPYPLFPGAECPRATASPVAPTLPKPQNPRQMNSHSHRVLKCRFYYYLDVVRPTDQEMTAIVNAVCYSQLSKGGGHAGGCEAPRGSVRRQRPKGRA